MFGLEEAVHRVIEAFGADDPRRCIRGELDDRVALLRTLKGATAQFESKVVRAIDALGDGGLDGAGVARTTGGMSSRAANATAKIAATLEELPSTEEALAAGRITAEHAATLARAAEKTDAGLVDAQLVAEAEQVPADVFATRSNRWVNRQLSAEDAAERLTRQRSQRELSSWVDDEGMRIWRLALDPIAAEAFGQSLEQRYERLWRDDGGREGCPGDVRTPGQRHADALVELVTSPGDDRPRHPRHQVTVVAEMGRFCTEQPEGFAETLDGRAIPQEALEHIGCDATFNLMLTDAGRPIWLGRDHRRASIQQWKALIARDRHCVGCGASASRCEAHHIEPWEHSGPTDITNLVLLCSRCHHDVHWRGAKVVPDGARGFRLEYSGQPPPRARPPTDDPADLGL
ncbi:MAG: DUF222 domain-containing protein [Actinomycetota bacterium]